MVDRKGMAEKVKSVAWCSQTLEVVMRPINPQYVVDENDNKKAVVLPLSEWEQILSDLEELDDIRAYDQAKSTPDEAIPFDQAVREIRNGYCEF